MKITVLFALYLFLTLTPAVAQSAGRLAEMSKAILTHLVEGQEERIMPYFDDRMSRFLQPSQLKLLWNGIVKENGPFQRAGDAEVVHKNGQTVVSRVCRFQKRKLLFNVTFDEKEQVAGIFFKEKD